MSGNDGNRTIGLDPIVAVEDVEFSAGWYCEVFGFNNAHGEGDFAVLTSKEGEIVLCLHAWEAHGHPTLQDRNIPSGNGLLLYFRMERWREVRQNLENMDWKIEEDVHQNPNSRKQEFSFRDPDGYFITVTELHHYHG